MIYFDDCPLKFCINMESYLSMFTGWEGVALGASKLSS